jgi:hypothetical protein
VELAHCGRREREIEREMSAIRKGDILNPGKEGNSVDCRVLGIIMTGELGRGCSHV